MAAMFGAGCGDESAGHATLGRLRGRIESLPDHLPAAAARITLLDPSTNDSPIPTAAVDATGAYLIDGIRPGWYYPIVEAGPMFVYAPLDAAVRIDAGRDARLDLDLATYPGLEGAGRPVHGIVVDDATGQPIAGAWVSAGFTDPAFLLGNGTPPWESRTDAAGRFELSGVPAVPSGEGLYPIVITHHAYRPGGTGSLVRGELLPILPVGGPPLQVEIRLRAGSGEQSIGGRVVHLGQSVGGVPVALTFADIDSAEIESAVFPAPSAGGILSVNPAAPAPGRHFGPGMSAPRALVPEAVTVTDPSGRFEFTGLTPGRYRVHAAYFPDDGWVPSTLGSGTPAPVRLGAADITDLEVAVLPGIELVSPGRLEVVDDVRPTLVWRSVAGADRYLVVFSWANSFFLNLNLTTTDTSAVLPPGLYRAGDQGRWAVQVYRDETLVASSEVVSTFTIGER